MKEKRYVSMNKGWKELHKNGFIRVGIFGALVFSVA